MEKILKVHRGNDYARYIGAPELHPLVSVIHYDELEHCRHSLNNYDVYGMFIGDETLEELTYGLTTYDLAGNIYTGGGIPEGVDIIAYDLYTASLLQDTLHAHTLAWFAELGASAACTPFKNTSMPQVRTQLSFYSDDNAGAAPGAQEADNALLNAIFTCKSESMLQLLKKHAPKGTCQKTKKR